MNRPKGSKPPKFAAAKAFWKNIAYLQAQNDMTNRTISQVLDISQSTLGNRRSKPQDTTLKEITRASEYFGIPVESLLVPFKPITVNAFDPEAEDERESYIDTITEDKQIMKRR